MSALPGAATGVVLVALAMVHGPARGRPIRTDATRCERAAPRARAAMWALVGTAAVSPVLATVIIVGLVGADHRRRHLASRTVRRTVADTMPDAVDLLGLCISAGQSLALAHPQVAAAVPGPLGAGLQRAATEANTGRSRAESLHDALTPLGGRASTLAHALVDHLRYGTPLGPTLDRLGAELRLDRRRRAEEEARRVPVRLLAPLLLCVLPAFVLLTVLPLLAASLRSLSL